MKRVMKQVKFRPSDVAEIRDVLKPTESLSGRLRDAILEYGSGPPSEPHTRELATEAVSVFTTSDDMSRAVERARIEKRTVGEALTEVILSHE